MSDAVQSRRFELHRAIDVSGVSGTGVVADGVEFGDGVVVLRWRGEFPSVVFHDRGIESVVHVHGHGGSTKVVWLDARHKSRLRSNPELRARRRDPPPPSV